MTTATRESDTPVWTLGDRLRKARELTGMDQSQFADALGVSRGTVANYESNRTQHVKRAYLRLWAMTCGVSLAWLAGGDQGDGPLGSVA